MKSLKFLTIHGVVEGHEGDCVQLTFGLSRVWVPYAPISEGIAKTITTMCDHDIGVIVDE